MASLEGCWLLLPSFAVSAMLEASRVSEAVRLEFLCGASYFYSPPTRAQIQKAQLLIWWWVAGFHMWAQQRCSSVARHAGFGGVADRWAQAGQTISELPDLPTLPLSQPHCSTQDHLLSSLSPSLLVFLPSLTTPGTLPIVECGTAVLTNENICLIKSRFKLHLG